MKNISNKYLVHKKDINFAVTSKFEWMLDDIRIENIVLASIWDTTFFEVSLLLDVRHCPKLQFCAISRKYNNATLRK